MFLARKYGHLDTRRAVKSKFELTLHALIYLTISITLLNIDIGILYQQMDIINSQSTILSIDGSKLKNNLKILDAKSLKIIFINVRYGSFSLADP